MHIDPVTPRLYSENLSGATGSRPADQAPEPSGGPAGFEPSPDRVKWAQALRDLPDVRADVVADAARRLRAGEVLSPSSPEETAQSVLGLLGPGE